MPKLPTAVIEKHIEIVLTMNVAEARALAFVLSQLDSADPTDSVFQALDVALMEVSRG